MYPRRPFDSPVLFQCPDVRSSGEADVLSESDSESDEVPSWRTIKPGVSYMGACLTRRCEAEQSRVLSNMGMGKHRPNEELCHEQIRCPACDSPFRPDQFFFYRCAAKINFCINGERPDELCVSENRDDKARVLGKTGSPVTYNMLIIEVERPGTFEDDSTLDTVCTTMPLQTLQLGVDSTWSAPKSLLSELLRPPHMDPPDIRYVQDSISSRFQCGRRIADTMNQLLSGTLSVDQIPTIRVFQWNGRWHSEDNRRLWAFKKAGLKRVPVKYVDMRSVDDRKFSTVNGGVSVRVR